MSPRRLRIADATEETFRKWRVRRARLLLPSLILLLGLVAGAFSNHLILGFALSAGLILGISFEIGSGWRSRNQATAPGIIFSATGRFRLEDFGGLRTFLSNDADVKRIRALWFTKGWAEGVFAFTRSDVLFIPGNIARRAGVPLISIPWSEVGQLEIIPQAFSAATGLEMTFYNSNHVSWEVRGRKRLTKALMDTELSD